MINHPVPRKLSHLSLLGMVQLNPRKTGLLEKPVFCIILILVGCFYNFYNFYCFSTPNTHTRQLRLQAHERA